MTRTETGFTGGGAISAKYAGGADVMATVAATVLTGAAGQTFTVVTASAVGIASTGTIV